MASLLGIVPIPFLDNNQAQILTVAVAAAAVFMFGQQALNTVVRPTGR